MVIEYVTAPTVRPRGWQNLRDKGGNKSPFSICERTHVSPSIRSTTAADSGHPLTCPSRQTCRGEQIPRAHTCFNKMDLPNSNREKLAEQLFKASRRAWASATFDLDAGCEFTVVFSQVVIFVLHTRVHASHPPRHLQAPGAAAPPPRLPWKSALLMLPW